MFEKEAEEIMMQKVIKEFDCIMTPCKTLEDCQLCDFCFDDMVDAFKDGAEFGYNKAKVEVEDSYRESLCNSELNLASVTEQLEELEKANEWHKVADGDLPKDDKQYLVLFFYNYKGKKEMSFGVRDNLHSDFEIKRCYTEQIIAWCEIPTFDKE